MVFLISSFQPIIIEKGFLYFLALLQSKLILPLKAVILLNKSRHNIHKTLPRTATYSSSQGQMSAIFCGFPSHGATTLVATFGEFGLLPPSAGQGSVPAALGDSARAVLWGAPPALLLLLVLVFPLLRVAPTCPCTVC